MRLTPRTADDRARLAYLNANALHILDELHTHNIPPQLGLGFKRRGLLYNDEVHGEMWQLMRGLRSVFQGAEVVVDMPILQQLVHELLSRHQRTAQWAMQQETVAALHITHTAYKSVLGSPCDRWRRRTTSARSTICPSACITTSI